MPACEIHQGPSELPSTNGAPGTIWDVVDRRCPHTTYNHRCPHPIYPCKCPHPISQCRNLYSMTLLHMIIIVCFHMTVSSLQKLTTKLVEWCVFKDQLLPEYVVKEMLVLWSEECSSNFTFPIHSHSTRGKTDNFFFYCLGGCQISQISRIQHLHISSNELCFTTCFTWSANSIHIIMLLIKYILIVLHVSCSSISVVKL